MKPMKAVDYDPAKLRFPLLASPKLDGLRCVIKEGVALSNTLKPIPSHCVQRILGNGLYNGLDGELIVGSPTAPNVFSDTMSYVMAHNKEFDFTYYVFDLWDCPYPYDYRAGLLTATLEKLYDGPDATVGRIKLLKQTLIDDFDELAKYEARMVAEGFEGIMLRDLNGMYKYGRSTVNEGFLLKVKRFADSEAVVIGFEEQMMNCNEASKNELGHTKRSSTKDGLVGKNTLGALHVRDTKTGTEFHVGTGMDDFNRAMIWSNKAVYLGKTITYKYFPIGVKDLPRHPVFKGFRALEDIS